MKKLLIIICLFVFIPGHSQPVKPVYEVVDGAIVGHNIGRYNNRPLYINNSNAFILAGDRPIIRLVKGEYIYGSFFVGIKRDGKGKWLHQCSDISSFYRPGRMCWEISDAEFSSLKITVETLPMVKTTGLALYIEAEGVSSGDSLIVVAGGAQWKKRQNMSWKLDVMGNPEVLNWVFNPQECKNNVIKTAGQSFCISLEDSIEHKNIFTLAGSCSEPVSFSKRDASAWGDIIDVEQVKDSHLPVLSGKIELKEKKKVYLALEAFEKPDTKESKFTDSQVAFEEGVKRTESLGDVLKIDTPDPYLNALARASVFAVDGTWYSPVFVHGAMQWNVRFPGWRTLYGGIMYGWHDRILEEARFYIDSQIQESEKKEAKADPSLLMTIQHPDSRFYGKGRIVKDQAFYNMQTQFFDQLIDEYRWTANPDLIKILIQALKLHLEWQADCFDPDGDGIYESYINSWPTDSQWYNGGGSAEETSYAYRGHLAARDMARNAGDTEAEKFHEQMLQKIRKGFFDKLWIKEKGYSGSYREQGGHERLHEDPSLYSIFLPIDVGLETQLQSLESLYYTEWALQNDIVPCGGRKVWASNWVPGIWSVREQWPGDNYHLALSYFKSGLPDDGWEVMRGTFMSTAFDHLVPGNLGGEQGGTDFGDCVHPFSRTLVEGLFGYCPDYPNRKVKLSPQFPPAWDHASISLPDVKIDYKRDNVRVHYSFELTRAANLEMYLPIQSAGIRKVLVNGKEVRWELIPGIGRSQLLVIQENMSKADVEIFTGKETDYHQPIFIEGNVGDIITIDVKNARIIDVNDPQEVLFEEKIVKSKITAKLSSNKGFHTVLVLAEEGKAPQWRIYRIKINDPVGDVRLKARFVDKIPSNANWDHVNVSSFFNGNITAIFQQQYLEPRPNTVSARLGVDGYSAWTFPFWKVVPPEIKLDKINSLLKKDLLITPQGVPFSWEGGPNNIVFTSLWKNYPEQVEIPVNKTGDAVYFLIAGSTNVMQCQIANAVIGLNYADGTKDSLELIPPVNYWNLCLVDVHATAPGQASRSYYTSSVDKFCMPAQFPETVELGENCRAMLLNLKLKPGIELKSICFKIFSQEVVIGLLGLSILKEQ